MKTLPLLLAGFCFLLLARETQAATTQHRAVAIAATVSTQVLTGSNSAILKTSRITNATILNTLARSGSFSGVSKASDMDIVIDTGTGGDNNPDFMKVINRSTHAVLYNVVQSSGSNSDNAGLVVYGNTVTKLHFLESSSNYFLNIPGASAYKLPGITARVTANESASEIFSLSMSFSGGADGAVVQGTIRTTPKVYNY